MKKSTSALQTSHRTRAMMSKRRGSVVVVVVVLWCLTFARFARSSDPKDGERSASPTAACYNTTFINSPEFHEVVSINAFQYQFIFRLKNLSECFIRISISDQKPLRNGTFSKFSIVLTEIRKIEQKTVNMSLNHELYSIVRIPTFMPA